MKKFLCLLTVIAMTLSFATFSAMAETTDSGAIVIAAPYVRQEDGAVGENRPTGDTNSVHYSYANGEYEESGKWKTLRELYHGYDAEYDVRRTSELNASVTMTPKTNVLSPGYYDVEWWNLYLSAYGDTTNVSYTIVYDGGLRIASGTFNPSTITNESWYKLGTYFFKGNGMESVTFANALNGSNLSIDAARFVPNRNMERSEVVIAIDDTATHLTDPTTEEFIAEVTSGGAAGTQAWKLFVKDSVFNSPYVNYKGEEKAMLESNASGTAAYVMAKPVAGKLIPGLYEAYWFNQTCPQNGYTTTLSYEVAYSGGSAKATGTFNPSTVGNNWISFGKFNFTGNGEEYIKVIKAANTGRMSASAGKFVPVNDADGNDIFSMYATVTNNTATEKIYPTLGKGEDGQDYYYFPSLGSAGTYTVTVEGAENATISIENQSATGTLTTDSYAVNGNAKVLEVTVTSNSGEEKKSLIIINRADAVEYNIQNIFEAVGSLDDSGVFSFDKTATKCTATNNAGGGWKIPANAVTPGYYKLQFYNCYNDTKPENAEFIASYTIDGVTVDQRIPVNLQKAAESVNNELTWLTIGEVYLTGNGTDTIYVFKRDSSPNYLRFAGIRLSNPDLMIEDYGIFGGDEKLTFPAAGDNKGVLKAYNFKAQDAAAHLILAKYDETGNLLNQVVYNKNSNNSARLNKGNINLETSAITVDADEKCVLKLFCWKEGTLAPLLEEIALDKTE